MPQQLAPIGQRLGRVYSPGNGNGNKLTPEIAMLILAALRRGSTRSAAVAMAGVSFITFHRWLDHRRVPLGVELPDLITGDMIDYGGMPFHEAVERAVQEAADFLKTRIMAAATDGYRETLHYGRNGTLLRAVREWDWKAAAWLLEHNPETRQDWATLNRMEMSGPNGQPIRTEGVQVVQWSPDAEWLSKYAAALKEIDGSIEGTVVDVTPSGEIGPGGQTKEG